MLRRIKLHRAREERKRRRVIIKQGQEEGHILGTLDINIETCLDEVLPKHDPDRSLYLKAFSVGYRKGKRA